MSPGFPAQKAVTYQQASSQLVVQEEQLHSYIHHFLQASALSWHTPVQRTWKHARR